MLLECLVWSTAGCLRVVSCGQQRGVSCGQHPIIYTDFTVIHTDFNIALAITQPIVVSGYFYSRLSIFLYCRPFAAGALFTSGSE
jgi:hypothetical protein